MYLDNDRRPTLTPQLAWRVAIIGGVALVAFAVIFFRLWYLQVLSSDKYVAAAQGNQLRRIKVQAPRGEIVDREGRVLVRNRVGLAVKITPDTLPEDGAERKRSTSASPSCWACAPRASNGAWTSSSMSCRFRRRRSSRTSVASIMMHIQEREGGLSRGRDRARPPARVSTRRGGRRPVRIRGRGDPGAAGRRSSLHRRGVGRPRRQGRHRGRVRPLPARPERRHPGARGRVRPAGQETGHDRAQAGQAAAPLADLDVQKVGQQALASGTGRGAFAVMDVRNGEVLALGSQPSFDPNLFARVVRESDYKRLISDEAGAPLTNRAVSGRLSHRVDVQADHRHGRARGGLHHAGHRPGRQRVDHRRRRGVLRTPATRCTARLPCARR